MHVLQSKKNLQLKQLITNCQLQRPNHSSYFGQILTKHKFLDDIIYARELVLKNFEINSILSSNQNNVIIIMFTLLCKSSGAQSLCEELISEVREWSDISSVISSK